MSILEFSTKNRWFFEQIKDENINSESNLEVKNYFFSLQKEQWNDIKNPENAHLMEYHVAEKYVAKWNTFIAKYPNSVLYFSGFQFNFKIICTGWNMPHCHFHGITFGGGVAFDAVFKGAALFSAIILSSGSGNAFSEAIFEEEVCFLDIRFVVAANFDKALFHKNAYFSKPIFEKSVSFFDLKFKEKVKFQSAHFQESVLFEIFEKSDEMIFSGGEFLKDVRFHGSNKDGCSISATQASFKDKTWFSGSFRRIDLRSSEFDKETYFEESFRKKYYDSLGSSEAEEAKKSGMAIFPESINEVSFARTIFRSIVFFSISFIKLPDFSRAVFQEVPKIDEELLPKLENKKEIKTGDENKFRFLKDYFLKQNNHQKEMKYFELEMIAKEKGSYGFKKVLYFLYSTIGSYGNSMAKPFYFLILSGIIFSFNFVSSIKFFSLSACFSSRIDAVNALIVRNSEMIDQIGTALTISFTRTIFPLVGLDYLTSSKSNFYVSHPFLLVVQSIISLVLLFLVGLGIKNEFKIK